MSQSSWPYLLCWHSCSSLLGSHLPSHRKPIRGSKQKQRLGSMPNNPTGSSWDNKYDSSPLPSSPPPQKPNKSLYLFGRRQGHNALTSQANTKCDATIQACVYHRIQVRYYPSSTPERPWQARADRVTVYCQVGQVREHRLMRPRNIFVAFPLPVRVTDALILTVVFFQCTEGGGCLLDYSQPNGQVIRCW